MKYNLTNYDTVVWSTTVHIFEQGDDNDEDDKGFWPWRHFWYISERIENVKSANGKLEIKHPLHHIWQNIWNPRIISNIYIFFRCHIEQFFCRSLIGCPRPWGVCFPVFQLIPEQDNSNVSFMSSLTNIWSLPSDIEHFLVNSSLAIPSDTVLIHYGHDMTQLMN